MGDDAAEVLRLVVKAAAKHAIMSRYVRKGEPVLLAEKGSDGAALVPAEALGRANTQATIGRLHNAAKLAREVLPVAEVALLEQEAATECGVVGGVQ